MTEISPLNNEWEAYISAHLKWVDGWIKPGSERKFNGPEGRIRLLQLIIDNGEIPKEETVKLQRLCTYFGQAIIEKTGWNWTIVRDEYGTDLAIQIPEKKPGYFL